jgi:serine phosphatase RsbU (regulator of sigma subunit)
LSSLGLFRGIKGKVTTSTIIAVVFTAGALTVLTSFLISYTFNLSLQTREQVTGQILTEALSGRTRTLVIRAQVISGDHDFLTAYSFRENELAHLQEELKGRLSKSNIPLGLIADITGKTVTASDTDAGQLLSKTQAFQRTLHTNETSTFVEYLGGKFAIVVATTINRYESQAIGYLVISQVFDPMLLDEMKKSSGAEIIFVHEGQVVLGTIRPDQGQGQFATLPSRFGKEDRAVTVEGVSVKGEPLRAAALPLRAASILQGSLVFALSMKESAALQRKVILSSLMMAGLITFLAGLVVFYIARRISRPIEEIERSFREIAASGDLSQRINVPYEDEIGTLAGSFNQMQEQIEQLHARVVVAEQRMRDELKMASTLQEMLFPTTAVSGTRCEFVSYWQPSTEIGGDWFSIAHSPETHTSTAIIADVTGHGTPAALVTAILHGFFKATRDELIATGGPKWQPDIEALLQTLNQMLIESTHKALTASLFLFSFDHRTLKARYANAGHLAALLVRSGKVASLPSPPSSLIGNLDAPTFAWGEVQLQPGDVFLLYTDGLVECTNTTHEMYGFKRLRKVLSTLGHQDARSVRDVILRDALTFFGEAPREDDVTMIVGSVR